MIARNRPNRQAGAVCLNDRLKEPERTKLFEFSISSDAYTIQQEFLGQISDFDAEPKANAANEMEGSGNVLCKLE